MFLFLLRGRRAGEVLSLDWKHIDLLNKKYTIIDSQRKIRKTLTFVLDEELIEALRCLNEQKEGLVFVSPVTGKKFYSFPKRLWKKLKENCEIADMKLHDFRHLLGYTLVNKGVPLEYISKALGHAKISTTQIYSNQKEQMASDAVNAYLDLMK
jgi:integrase